jgi:hypothetical protein
MPDLFDASPVTRHDKLRCIRRELEYRRRVYPRWVRAGKMLQVSADREIATMEAILGDYERGA